MNYAAVVRGDKPKNPSPVPEPREPSPQPFAVDESIPLKEPEDYMQYASPLATKKILTPVEYMAITKFIEDYNGLAINCLTEMIKTEFTNIDPKTLKGIVDIVFIERARTYSSLYNNKVVYYVEIYDQLCRSRNDPSILLDLAIQEHMSPVMLCRVVVKSKLCLRLNSGISAYLKDPSQILYNDLLRANVRQCLKLDITDGPAITLERQERGLKYEAMLQAKCKEANVRFIDETEMRRRCYRKTPDVKIEDKLFYKGNRVYWIESKACFGDKKSHKHNITHQLSQYQALYGPGIVIYWFGYATNVPNMTAHDGGITVLDDFPPLEDLRVVSTAAGDGVGTGDGIGNGNGVGDGNSDRAVSGGGDVC